MQLAWLVQCIQCRGDENFSEETPLSLCLGLVGSNKLIIGPLYSSEPNNASSTGLPQYTYGH